MLLKGSPAPRKPAGLLAGCPTPSPRCQHPFACLTHTHTHTHAAPACPPASPLAGNAKKLLKGVQEGGKQYHFVEVMACPGGCIGGGGQPRSKDKEILQKRQAALYK